MTELNRNNRFPKSLSILGLTPGFTHKQFCIVMDFERSDDLRMLAHSEWESEQKLEYDHSNWRWELSYVSMKNEYTIDFNYKPTSAKEP